jgi:mannose-6-phosphate isomerase-like protein (cupin superfamily)
MQFASKKEAFTRKNNETTSITKYPIQDDSLDIALVKIEGRYPDAKRAVNLECKEIIYVMEGKGKVIVEGKEQNFEAGDLILIEAKEKFYWEGKTSLYITCMPAWNAEQHQIVE